MPPQETPVGKNTPYDFNLAPTLVPRPSIIDRPQPRASIPTTTPTDFVAAIGAINEKRAEELNFDSSSSTPDLKNNSPSVTGVAETTDVSVLEKLA